MRDSPLVAVVLPFSGIVLFIIAVPALVSRLFFGNWNWGLQVSFTALAIFSAGVWRERRKIKQNRLPDAQ
jgi:membrane protein implicated in regulation of membrane protease activity